MQEKPDLFIAVEDSSQIIAMEFNADSSHDIWDESDAIDTETMDKITERYINEASKGDMEGYVKALSIHSKRRAVPCHGIFILKS